MHTMTSKYGYVSPLPAVDTLDECTEDDVVMMSEIVSVEGTAASPDGDHSSSSSKKRIRSDRSTSVEKCGWASPNGNRFAIVINE